MTALTISEQYAKFAAELELEVVPGELLEKAKLHILDTIGCALAASRTEYAKRMLRGFIRLEGGDGAVAMGHPQTLGLRDAIVFNGGLANTLDFDDTYVPTLNHISGGTVPLVLALGAKRIHRSVTPDAS